MIVIMQEEFLFKQQQEQKIMLIGTTNMSRYLVEYYGKHKMEIFAKQCNIGFN